MAVKAGCDLNCGCTYEHIPFAIEEGLLVEADMDVCVKRLFRARMRLGMFDPPARVPWASIPYERNDCPEHHALARTAARESIVLLKNEGGLLPLKKDVGSIAVIGPNAYDPHVLVANYFGVPSRAVTPLDGIREAVSPRTQGDVHGRLQAAGDQDRRARARRQPVGGGERRGARRRRGAVPGAVGRHRGRAGRRRQLRGGGRQDRPEAARAAAARCWR